MRLLQIYITYLLLIVCDYCRYTTCLLVCDYCRIQHAGQFATAVEFIRKRYVYSAGVSNRRSENTCRGVSQDPGMRGWCCALLQLQQTWDRFDRATSRPAPPPPFALHSPIEVFVFCCMYTYGVLLYGSMWQNVSLCAFPAPTVRFRSPAACSRRPPPSSLPPSLPKSNRCRRFCCTLFRSSAVVHQQASAARQGPDCGDRERHQAPKRRPGFRGGAD